MRARTLLGLLIPLASAALFVRLGFWQISRHQERVAVLRALEARLQAEPVEFSTTVAHAADPTWTLVRVEGRFRYDLEQVQAARTNAGSPGVHLITPLEVPGSDTLVIVTRGWVYSPDAASAELPRWRESEAITLTGYLLPLPAEGLQAPANPALPLRSLNRAALAARVGYPVASVQIVMTSDSTARIDSVPRRLPPPAPDAGPHRSYALQWFSFALIALIGGGILFRRGIVADRASR